MNAKITIEGSNNLTLKVHTKKKPSVGFALLKQMTKVSHYKAKEQKPEFMLDRKERVAKKTSPLRLNGEKNFTFENSVEKLSASSKIGKSGFAKKPQANSKSSLEVIERELIIDD